MLPVYAIPLCLILFMRQTYTYFFNSQNFIRQIFFRRTPNYALCIMNYALTLLIHAPGTYAVAYLPTPCNSTNTRF